MSCHLNSTERKSTTSTVIANSGDVDQGLVLRRRRLVMSHRECKISDYLIGSLLGTNSRVRAGFGLTTIDAIQPVRHQLPMVAS